MMVVEQKGARSSAIACRQFLTYDDLAELTHSLGVEWEIIRPWYGIRWALRPALARLRRTREPATFAILIARRSKYG